MKKKSLMMVVIGVFLLAVVGAANADPVENVYANAGSNATSIIDATGNAADADSVANANQMVVLNSPAKTEATVRTYPMLGEMTAFPFPVQALNGSAHNVQRPESLILMNNGVLTYGQWKKLAAQVGDVKVKPRIYAGGKPLKDTDKIQVVVAKTRVLKETGYFKSYTKVDGKEIGLVSCTADGKGVLTWDAMVTAANLAGDNGANIAYLNAWGAENKNYGDGGGVNLGGSFGMFTGSKGAYTLASGIGYNRGRVWKEYFPHVSALLVKGTQIEQNFYGGGE